MAPSAVDATKTDGTPAGKAKPVTIDLGSGDPSLAHVEEAVSHPPTFEDKTAERRFLKHRLALAFRIFAKHGFMEGIAGHITVRDPVDPSSFWVNPFGLHFALITDDDLIRVDHEGKVIEGGRNRMLNYAAFAIHSEIHKARPDVLCAAHSHSVYGRAMCTTGRTLDMLTQDFCMFYDDQVVYPKFSGVVLATEEGRRIAETLGNRKAAFLSNHGLLTAGPSIEAAVNWFVMLEKCSQVQLAAEAAVGGRREELLTIGAEEAQATWQSIGGPESAYFQGLPLFQLAEREFGEATFMGQGVEPL
ncbi:class 2 aldolase adducin domain containing protein [Grosmannia clavigera kw1407]|uniref:Class 2 aldolase adducin domain containing protein n=1 Tax=Grosmannia clavigera (strain kw1407 / UAMH 11150) TaxID=655863 RepID=F0XP98_GROCL|nr:class 2 aldolase adducin domain containing protein [Grosmannia clavigera kw1407]EFX00574.1 class 2 aldolase adducin domain containing protein [Grosmannia clavigera kw1407]